MKYEEFYEERILSDVAKGRFPKAKVKEIFHTLCRVVAKNVEKAVFEYCWLFCLQTLHAEFGFGQKRLQRFFDEASKAVDAVEVVRCRNCSRSIPYDDGSDNYVCAFGGTRKGDDFCSHGERRKER